MNFLKKMPHQGIFLSLTYELKACLKATSFREAAF